MVGWVITIKRWNELQNAKEVDIIFINTSLNKLILISVVLLVIKFVSRTSDIALPTHNLTGQGRLPHWYYISGKVTAGVDYLQ